MNIEKSLQEIMDTALEHANPIDPATEVWNLCGLVYLYREENAKEVEE